MLTFARTSPTSCNVTLADLGAVSMGRSGGRCCCMSGWHSGFPGAGRVGGGPVRLVNTDSVDALLSC
jgi:hypothetical protein